MAQHEKPRKTKIIATIGPASDSPHVLEQMMIAGMNVARLNFSHGDNAAHEGRLLRIREVAAKIGANIAIMLDTRGFEIRTGVLRDGPVTLVPGATVDLYSQDSDRLGDASGFAISYPKLHAEVRAGDTVLIDDGLLELRIEGIVDGSTVRCSVVTGGLLRDNKGVALPNNDLKFGGATLLSEQELRFAVAHNVDYIAASFVRSADDVHTIRDLLKANGISVPIIAKIESRSAVKNLAAIVAVADGTMVARGDLGVQLPLMEIPVIQKQIIRTTVMNGKPVITATQMLDSMERNPRPTRAEATDVANAIFDGTSAVMLSGESASGQYPVEAVRTMSTLARHAESELATYGSLQRTIPSVTNMLTESVTMAAVTMANHVKAAAIITLTESGFTSRLVSKLRPECPIVAVTTSPVVHRRLAMNWGITAVLCEPGMSDEATISFAVSRTQDLGYAEPGDVLVVTAARLGVVPWKVEARAISSSPASQSHPSMVPGSTG